MGPQHLLYTDSGRWGKSEVARNHPNHRTIEARQIRASEFLIRSNRTVAHGPLLLKIIFAATGSPASFAIAPQSINAMVPSHCHRLAHLRTVARPVPKAGCRRLDTAVFYSHHNCGACAGNTGVGTPVFPLRPSPCLPFRSVPHPRRHLISI